MKALYRYFAWSGARADIYCGLSQAGEPRVSAAPVGADSDRSKYPPSGGVIHRCTLERSCAQYWSRYDGRVRQSNSRIKNVNTTQHHMAFRDDDDKEKEGGDLMEGSAEGVLGETDDEEDDPMLGTGVDEEEKAWE